MCRSHAEGGRRCTGHRLSLDQHRERAERRRERDRERKRARRRGEGRQSASLAALTANLTTTGGLNLVNLGDTSDETRAQVEALAPFGRDMDAIRATLPETREQAIADIAAVRKAYDDAQATVRRIDNPADPESRAAWKRRDDANELFGWVKDGLRIIDAAEADKDKVDALLAARDVYDQAKAAHDAAFKAFYADGARYTRDNPLAVAEEVAERDRDRAESVLLSARNALDVAAQAREQGVSPEDIAPSTKAGRARKQKKADAEYAAELGITDNTALKGIPANRLDKIRHTSSPETDLSDDYARRVTEWDDGSGERVSLTTADVKPGDLVWRYVKRRSKTIRESHRVVSAEPIAVRKGTVYFRVVTEGANDAEHAELLEDEANLKRDARGF